jgi:hypothetical protein
MSRQQHNRRAAFIVIDAALRFVCHRQWSFSPAFIYRIDLRQGSTIETRSL